MSKLMISFPKTALASSILTETLVVRNVLKANGLTAGIIAVSTAKQVMNVHHLWKCLKMVHADQELFSQSQEKLAV